MIYRVLVGLLLFFHAAVSLLMIFGLGFGVGLGEISQDYARAQSNYFMVYGFLFALAGFTTLFPYKYGYYLATVLMVFTLFYLLWLMLSRQGDLSFQLVFFFAEVACLCFIAWTYKENFLQKT